MDTDPNAAENQGRLRLAVQKKGRLADDTFDLLKRCGLRVSASKNRLYARIKELPIDILLVRDDDIPALVASGASDVGIVGGNVFQEELSGGRLDDVPMVIPLGFSRCRLCIAIRKEHHYDGPSHFDGMRIATSYPALTEAWLREQGVTDARAVIMNGAHEIAPRLGVADAVCDIVSTGGTLDANGLKVAETIYRSEALLIGNSLSDPAKAKVAEALKLRIEGVQRSRDAKYVMLNAPRSAVDRISAVLPASETPTVLELAGETDKVAVHTVCSEEVVWEQLEELKSLGASGILVLDIDKMLA